VLLLLTWEGRSWAFIHVGTERERERERERGKSLGGWGLWGQEKTIVVING